MTDLSRLSRLPERPHRSLLASSYDREAETGSWFGNRDSGNYVRVEGDERVMLDVTGPGVVTRIWSANPSGELRIYVDGASTPTFAAPMGDLLRGRVSPFGPPFGFVAARGGNLYFPIAFREACRITVSADRIYYHVNYRLYSDPVDIESFSRASVERALPMMLEVGEALLTPPRRPPEGACGMSGTLSVGPGAGRSRSRPRRAAA